MIDFGFSMEERKKIEDIRLKTRGLAKKAKAISYRSDNEEPSGKQTNPNDVDLLRDGKFDE